MDSDTDINNQDLRSVLGRAKDRAFEYGCLRAWAEAYALARRNKGIAEAILAADEACGLKPETQSGH